MVKLQQTYIVGVGRLGEEALEHFKRRAEAAYGELPAIKLLAIDVPAVSSADEPALEPTAPRAAALGPTECVSLPLNLNPAHAQRALPWLQPDVIARGEAWTRTRSAARAAWHLNLQALYPFLAAHLNEMGSVSARDSMAAKGFDVSTDRTEAALILIGDISDLAGSALLLDVAYVFHHLFHTTGLQIASTALLLLPSLTRSDPVAEARAYATLKEINAHMGDRINGRRPYRCAYGPPEAPFLVIESDAPVFNRGCYLIDTRNEKTLTLKDEHEAARLVGEWLLRTLLTPLKARIDDFAVSQGAIPWAQGQLAAYNSLGFAAYTLPIDNLTTWSACRLGEAVLSEQLLKPEMFASVSDRLNTLMTATHLRPDDLMSDVLRHDRDGKPIRLQSDLIARLKTLPRDQIAASVQSAINIINRETLPSLRRQIEANARRVAQDVEEAIDQEVTTILRARPVGGVSLATQLVGRVRDDAGRFLQSLARREAALLARNQQQISFLARQGPLLKNAIAGIPSAPVTAIGIVAGFLAPLVLASSWLWQVLQFGSPALRLGVIAGAWIVAFAGALYALWQATFGVERIRDQYVTYLQTRFETELSLMLAQAARTLYADVASVAERKLSQLEHFSGMLHQLARAYRRRAEQTPLTGNIDFSLQRSVLSEASVEALYQRYAGQNDSEAHAYALVEKAGALDRWLEWRNEEVDLAILEYGASVFAPMRELRVEALAREQPDLDRAARELNDRAAPLCAFNVYHAGQAPVSSAQTFVGLESADQSELRELFERINPTAIFESTGDRFAITVTSARRGMPLFGLLRLSDFRRNYFDALRRRVEPLHLDDEMALTPDLNAMSTAGPGCAQTDPGSVFAIGMAFGLIARDGGPDSVYIARDDNGNEIARLASERLESAVLLGADDKLLSRLDGFIQERLASKSAGELARDLTSHLQRADVSAWERRRVEEHIAMLRR